MTQECTGFSPNELVFAHTARGPLTALSGNWVKPQPLKNLIDYINGFRHRLYTAGEMAKEKLALAQGKIKHLYDRHAEHRTFSPGDQVLALLPIVTSPFQAKFTGPHTVLKQLSEQNYVMSTPDRKKTTQMCHVNLLKPYYARPSASSSVGAQPDVVQAHAMCAAGPVSGESPPSLLECDEDELNMSDSALLHGCLKNSEALCNLDSLLTHLPESCREELVKLI